MIFKFFIIAAFIFGGFRVLNFITERLNIHLIQRNKLHYLIPLFEFFIWMLYVIWVVKVIYESKNYFALISLAVVIVLLAFPLFILIRDFISGIILKVQNKVAEGMYIDIEELKGLISNAGHLRMDIEDKHGNITSVTYHYVYGKRISRSGNNQNLEKISLEFDFPEPARVNEFSDSLKKAVMNTPWVVISQAPIIENTKVENGRLTVEVGAFVIDKSYAENIKSAVSSSLHSV